MILRTLQAELILQLEHMPAVALLGPRQVGKTTLAQDIATTRPSVYLDLEDALDLQKARNMKSFFAENSGKLIVLDEVQRLPELFLTLRGIIDQQRRKGKRSGLFLCLGSASLDLLRQTSESLAGRMAYEELHPVNVLEFAGKDPRLLSTLWVRGGFPESLLASSERFSLNWRMNFIKTYLERDIPQLGPRIPSATLLRLWTMLAHQQGALINASDLGRNLEVSSVSIHRYLDLLSDLMLIRSLPAWSSNAGKRLVRSPKIYIRDSGITHALLRIPSLNDLLGHPVMGSSWEGFVIENLLSVLPDQVQPYFYRTSSGAEIDLLLEWAGMERWAIEIKRSSAPSVSKGFHAACSDIQPQRRLVVYGGADRFSMGPGLEAIPLADLMQDIQRRG